MKKLRRSSMFIAPAARPSSSSDRSEMIQMMNESSRQNIPLLRSSRIQLSSRGYKHFVPMGLFVLGLVCSLLLLVNCQTRKTEPVAIVPEDMCSFCKMAISEKRYAAELLDNEGQAFKFDDIGCMLNFIKNKKDSAKVAAYFVMDFDERVWTRAEGAYFVRSSEVSPPMNGGLIAFKDEAKAQQAAEKYHGQLIRFKDILQ